MKRVVLIGDSIRMNYEDLVRERLKGECEVLSPKDNCAYTLNSIFHIRRWFQEMGAEHVDLIHWNNGIWEHHRNAEDNEPFSPPEIYLSLTKRLHNQLKRYSDKIVWASTIPAGPRYDPDGHILLFLSREDWNREIALYNGIASAYFKSEGVPINDLYSLIDSDPERYVCEDGIHLTDEGKEAAAEQVAAKIREQLKLL